MPHTVFQTLSIASTVPQRTDRWIAVWLVHGFSLRKQLLPTPQIWGVGGTRALAHSIDPLVIDLLVDLLVDLRVDLVFVDLLVVDLLVTPS